MTDLDKLRSDAETARQYAQHHGVKIWTEHIFAALALADAALARIAKVEALHASATIYELKAQYLPDESRPIHDYCVECTADSTISMIDDCEWDADWPIVTYPCATVRALTEGENE